MTIALIGGYGQLGTALSRKLGTRSVSLSHADCDLLRFREASARLDSLSPELVINCAAYNFVDAAEDDLQSAHRLNAVAPGQLADYCAVRDIPLVHIGSDYVFGRKNLSDPRPFAEGVEPVPDSVYGATKLAGERRVQAKWKKHFLIRTCGLYGARRSEGKGNFIETLLKLASERDELRVVDDQICTPTFTDDLADAIVALVPTQAYGLYHATNSGETTWFRLAKELFRLKDIEIRLSPSTSAEFGAKALRPPYSVLDCERVRDTTGFQLPDWREALARYLESRES